MPPSRFSKLAAKLERKGHSKESARRIAASIGMHKYGKEAMAKKSAASRERHEGE